MPAKQQDQAKNPKNPNRPVPLRGVGVIRTRPRGGPTIRIVTINNAHNTPICAANQQKRARHNHKHGPHHHSLPAPPPVLAAPVVVQPHGAHGLEAHERAEQRADERDQPAEDGDRGRNDVRGERDGGREAEPGDPVLGGVVVEVVGAAEGADEEVFCGDLKN